MDRLQAMSLFLTALEAGSLSAAGRRLNLPLTTVSRRIADLEAHLGTRLLQRTSRQLALTDAGRAYAQDCRRILDQVEEAERAAAGEYRAPRGTLAVTAPIVFGRLHVLPVACAFLDAFPEVDLRLMQSDRMVDLLEEHIDLAVRIGDLPDSSLVAVRVGRIHRVVCASPAYLARAGTPLRPEDLAGHACIAFDGVTSGGQWRFAETAAVAVKARLRVSTAEAAIDAALAGVGVTCVLSYQVADALREGRLTRLLPGFEPPAVPVSLVHAGDRIMPAKLRAFLDFAAPRLAARLR